MENGLAEVEEVMKRLEKNNKFSDRYGVAPKNETSRLLADMRNLEGSLPDIETPKNLDELFISEAKRRVSGEAFYLEQLLEGAEYSFDQVMKIFGIPQQDIDELKPWLEQNKEKTEQAIGRLFSKREMAGYELPLSLDVPNVRRQSEEFAAANIHKYHRVIGRFLEGLTNVGEFLRDINATATDSDRSYFNTITNTLAISVPGICFSTEDGTLHLREGELIRIYGHEGMGHALNSVFTKAQKLPDFLKTCSSLAVAAQESVAQFYETRLLIDLKDSLQLQKRLGIEHKFDAIYQEHEDTEQLEEYKRKMFQYGITVLADRALGEMNDPLTLRRKIDILNQISLSRIYAVNLVNKYRYSFDSEGNLDSGLVAELRYCARPVERALDEFRKVGIKYEGEGRNKIDSTLLKGFWTPIGFVEHARVSAANGNGH